MLGRFGGPDEQEQTPKKAPTMESRKSGLGSSRQLLQRMTLFGGGPSQAKQLADSLKKFDVPNRASTISGTSFHSVDESRDAVRSHESSAPKMI